MNQTDPTVEPCSCRTNPALTAQIGYPVRCPHCPPGAAAVPPTHWTKHVQRHHPEHASAVVSPPPSRAALRDRIRRAVCEAEGFAWDTDMLEPDEYGEVADAVLAVLGEQADRAADDLAIARATNRRLNHEKQRLESELASYRRAITKWEISEHGTYVPLRSLSAIAKAAGLPVPERWELHYQRVERLESELRRLAVEAHDTGTQQQEAHPAEHSWAAELYDPLADEWVPGTRFLVRDRAVKALEHGRRIGPTWKDGTPTRRRLVRATTTYTVEEPAPVAQQPATAEGSGLCAGCGMHDYKH